MSDQLKAAKPRTTFISPEARAIAGSDWSVGILLSQIMYWHRLAKNGKSKLKVERDGHMWIAKTGQQWMDETNLTIRQYKRALSILKRRSIIVVEIHKFGPNTATFIRLVTSKADNHLCENHITGTDHDVPSGTDHDVPSGKNNVALHIETNANVINDLHSPKITTENTTEGYGHISSELAFAFNKSHEQEEKIMGIEKIEGMKKEESEEGNLLTEKKKINAEEMIEIQTGKSYIESIANKWTSRCSFEYGEYQEPLTAAEQGQLEQLAENHPNAIQTIIDWVIPNWQIFIQEVAVTTGLDEVPASAALNGAIGFLLEHHDVAVNLMASPELTTSYQFKPAPEGAAQSNQESASDKPAE